MRRLAALAVSCALAVAPAGPVAAQSVRAVAVGLPAYEGPASVVVPGPGSATEALPGLSAPLEALGLSGLEPPGLPGVHGIVRPAPSTSSGVEGPHRRASTGSARTAQAPGAASVGLRRFLAGRGSRLQGRGGVRTGFETLERLGATFDRSIARRGAVELEAGSGLEVLSRPSRSPRTAVRALASAPEPPKQDETGVSRVSPDLKRILYGAGVGLLLVAAPLASAFAFGPVDQAVGLAPIPIAAIAARFGLLGLPVVLASAAQSLLVAVFGFATLRMAVARAGSGRNPWPAVFGAALLAPVALLMLAGPAAGALGFLKVVSGLWTVVAATGEEALFRGVLLGALLSRFRADGNPQAVGRAVLVSSLMFSVAHFFVHGFTFDLFVLKLAAGIVFALLYLRSGGLAMPAAAHSAYNLFVPFLEAIGGFTAITGLAALAAAPLAFVFAARARP